MKKWLTKLLFIFIGLIVSVVILEVVLRIAGISYPNFYTPDTDRGFALRPGAEGWWRKEGEAYIKISSDGLRDRERTKAKPANTFRVVILGDSMIEALQVPLENTLCAILEKRLRECETFAGKEIEVINFGVSSYGTAQELITLRKFVWSYSPDLVVLGFTTNNDLLDNSPALAQDPDLRAYFTYRDGALQPDTSFSNSGRFRGQQSFLGRLAIWLKNHFRVVQVFNEARAQSRARKELKQMEAKDIYSLVYKEPSDPAWVDSWKITEGLLLLMRDEVKQRGAKFLVVTLSTGIQVNPDPSVRQQYMKRNEIDDLFYPEKRIRALGEREGFQVESLAPAFQAYAEQKGVFLHGFKETLGAGHWNQEGNRLAAEMLTQYICQMSF